MYHDGVLTLLQGFGEMVQLVASPNPRHLPQCPKDLPKSFACCLLCVVPLFLLVCQQLVIVQCMVPCLSVDVWVLPNLDHLARLATLLLVPTVVL